MKAIVYRKAGPPSVLEVANDWPQPERAINHVKVKIFATSVNPIDFKARAGKAFPYLLKVPHVSSRCHSVQCLPPGHFQAWRFRLARVLTCSKQCDFCCVGVPVVLTGCVVQMPGCDLAGVVVDCDITRSRVCFATSNTFCSNAACALVIEAQFMSGVQFIPGDKVFGMTNTFAPWRQEGVQSTSMWWCHFRRRPFQPSL